jgi:hypothetical protein
LEEEYNYADFENAFMEAEPLFYDFIARQYTIAYNYKVLFGLPPQDRPVGRP